MSLCMLGDGMELLLMSDHWRVQRLTEDNITEIYELCSKNILYYQYCPPFVTKESIAGDMKALPPGKECSDKYYLGYFEERKLIAVMDLILGYPDKDTAFIGFFMTDVSAQNKGIGSRIINDLCNCLKDLGFLRVRLGRVKDNPQAEHFWQKNGFTEAGETRDTGLYTVILAQKTL